MMTWRDPAVLALATFAAFFTELVGTAGQVVGPARGRVVVAAHEVTATMLQDSRASNIGSPHLHSNT